MTDHKDTRDQPVHSRDPARSAKEDAGRTHPLQFNEVRPKAEIVAQAYDHEDPTPTQEECDEAKMSAVYQDPGSLDPQSAAQKKEREQKEREQKDMEAGRAGGYQTRDARPAAPSPSPSPKANS